ncbi:LUD domain-containing protein [Quadrisphaera sp. DSM 44207]|uniref:LutC/YkgG family protein n=1 Tax=Quadrisphaera sp. DSM 44207 TaxID=1881057 RepID=UPI00088FAB0E|nr:LUD domain-containing protein [Quadrisphaera sp. DSM 44207]SDQ06924.1 L-lactate dehydrogenase complex protein LldG [Quadrisphaera sp. DSM 44207]
MSAREEVLARLRAARDAGAPAGGVAAVPRRYRARGEHAPGSAAVVELLVERVEDYRAAVHRTGPGGVAALVADLLADAASVAVPPGLDAGWTAGCAAALLVDGDPAPLDAQRLDAVDAVVTASAVAIAETGTIVLDATDPRQGRRLLSLVPDHHVCVVAAADVVGTVPEALARLDPQHPLTFVSGPSATSDIELDRVEGVHGPRRLDVVLVG